MLKVGDKEVTLVVANQHPVLKIVDKSALVYDACSFSFAKVTANAKVTMTFTNTQFGYVDWGDGTDVQFFDSPDTALSHTYSLAISPLTILCYVSKGPAPICSLGKTYSSSTPVESTVYLNNSVTSLEGSFSSWRGMTACLLPDSLVNVGDKAFYECVNLTSIDIPKNVTNIGSDAFYGCVKLTSVVIPSGVINIGGSAFLNCSLSNITIPDTVTSIGGGAFWGTPLTTLVIPEGVTFIGNAAFRGCSRLTTISVPNSIVTVGDYVFYDCTNLTRYYYDDASYVGNASNSYAALIYGGSSTRTGCVIHSETRAIAAEAFWHYSELTSLVIPGKVKGIGHTAFAGCDSLASVTIPSSIVSIGKSAFLVCYALTTVNYTGTVDSWCEITFEDSSSNPVDYAKSLYINGSLVTSPVIASAVKIGDYAFSSCESLTSITIGNSVASIGNYAFNECTRLTSVSVPSSVTSIGDGAFYKCQSLASIAIPASVQTIGSSVLRYCDNLSALSVASNNPNYKSVDDTLYTKDGTILIQCAAAKARSSFTVPSSVTTIKAEAFFGCYTSLQELTLPFVGGNLTGEVASSSTLFGYIFGLFSYAGGISTRQYYSSSKSTTYYIPSSLRKVTILGGALLYGAFYGCNKLTTIVIGPNVTSIGTDTFYGCKNLTTVTVGVGVVSIGKYVFGSCDNLTSLTYTGTVAQWDAIQKDSGWNSLSSVQYVYCSNGTVSI